MKRLHMGYHRLSIFSKILLWMVVVSIIPLSIVSIQSIYRITALENNRCENEVINRLQWVENDVNAMVSEMRMQAIRTAADASVVAAVSANVPADSAMVYQMQKALYGYFAGQNYHSVYILGDNGTRVSTYGSIQLMNLMGASYADYAAHLENSRRTFVWEDPMQFGSEYFIPYVRFIYDETGEAAGLLIVNFSERALRQVAQSNLHQSTFDPCGVMITNDRVILSSQNGNDINSDIDIDARALQYAGKDCVLLKFSNSKHSDWNYIALVANRDIHASSRNMMITLGFLIGVCLLFIIVASTMVSRSISRPLKYLSNAMLELGNHNMNVEIKQPLYNDEVGQMWNSLIEMTQMLKSARAESERAMRMNQRLRYEALKAQINPHFIYNTFASVIFLIEDGRQKKATEMLAALAELLHISISRTKEYIPVEQELGLVRNYMDIQRVRYHEGFRYIIDVDMDVMKLRTIKIILQPAIENALEHGMRAKRDDQATLWISGRRQEDLLVFDIIDDCDNLTEERMAEVNRMIHSNQMDSSKRVGIGLKNVNDRIRFEFPGDDRLGVTLIKRNRKTVTHIVTKPVEEDHEKLESVDM